MKTIIYLFGVMFLILSGTGNSYSAASSVVYPNNWQFTRNNLSLEPMTVSKASAGTRTFFQGGAIHSPMDSSALKSVMRSSAAEAIGDAITLKSPVNYPLVGKYLVRGIAGGALGIGATYLASIGIDYIAGQFHQLAGMTWTNCSYFGNPNSGLNAVQACQAAGWTSAGPVNNLNGGAQCLGTSGQYQGGNVQCYTSSQPASTVITQQQAESQAAASPINPTDSDIQMMLDAGWGVPIQPKAEVVIDLSNLNSTALAELTSLGYFQEGGKAYIPAESYPVFDERTNSWRQVYLEVAPAPNAGLAISAVEVPVQAPVAHTDGSPFKHGEIARNPDGSPITNLQPILKPTSSAESSANPLAADQVDPCTLNLDRAGCANLGTPDAETITPSSRTVTGEFNQFNISGQCPADKTFSISGMTHTIQMAPICGAAENYIKPFLLLMASVTAYFIFVGGLRT